MVQEGEGVVNVAVTSDPAKLYYKTHLHNPEQSGEGWITAAGTVTIKVTASNDTDWTIEALK